MVSQLMEVIKIGLQKKIKATWVKQGGSLDRLYAHRYRKSPREFVVVEPFRLNRTVFLSAHVEDQVTWTGRNPSSCMPLLMVQTTKKRPKKSPF